MFVTETATIGLSLASATAQLAKTMESSSFRQISDHAYAAGLAVLDRPHGCACRLATTMHTCLAGPAQPIGCAYALRWETSGPADRLHPVFDADLTLTQAGPARTRLAITACYRPPPGTILRSRPLLSRTARTTLQSVLHGLANEIVNGRV